MKPEEPLELTEAAEEALAAIWQAREEGGSLTETQLGERGSDALAELCGAGLVEVREGALSLTEAGEREAASVIRRERLAERLLADVLDVGGTAADAAACKFEHILRAGLDDEICTLLGHPRVCPHGSPIPRGPCCEQGAVAAPKVISSLADLEPGQRGVIAYLHSQRRDLVQRLLTLGAVPGTPVQLLQRVPSYVVQLGNTQIALDRETAGDVYVRLTGPPPGPGPRQRRLRLRWRRGRGHP